MRCLAIKLFSAPNGLVNKTFLLSLRTTYSTTLFFFLSNIRVCKEISSIKWVNDDTSNSPVTNVCRRKLICVAKVLFT